MNAILETLDLRSMGITLSLCGLALTAVLWAARRDGDDIEGLKMWVGSAFAISAGLGFSALLGWIPDGASRLLGNTLLAAAPFLAWQGARAFHGKSSSRWLIIAVASITLLWSAVFVYVWPSTRLRIILVSLTMAGGCFVAGREFLRTNDARLRTAARFGGIPMLVFALMMAVRAGDAWAKTESEMSHALISTPINLATYMLGSIVLLTTIAGMVMSVVSTRAATIRDLAYRDLLTSVLSRRGLYARLPQWMKQRANGAIVVVLDANGFKRVNDMLGHEMGDKILQALASSCVSSLPHGSLVARFGGDEFVALVADIQSDTNTMLTTLAEAFHEKCAFLLGDSSAPLPTVAMGRATLIGVTTHDFAAALREADAAMYAQKVRQGEMV